MIKLAKFIPTSIRSALKRCLHTHSLHMSQAGQDFWVLGEVFNEKRNGYFLDIGAADGVCLSNTYLLEYRYKWSGICVEGNPETFQYLRKNRRVICVNACLDSSEGFVSFSKSKYYLFSGIVSEDTDNKDGDKKSSEIIRIKTRTLDSVLSENNAPDKIDYLSIDVEGAEQRVLGGFSFQKYQFNCITIERPTEHLRALLKEHGYILIKDIPGLDCFYVHSSFLNQYLINLSKFYEKKYLIMRFK